MTMISCSLWNETGSRGASARKNKTTAPRVLPKNSPLGQAQCCQPRTLVLHGSHADKAWSSKTGSKSACKDVLQTLVRPCVLFLELWQSAYPQLNDMSRCIGGMGRKGCRFKAGEDKLLHFMKCSNCRCKSIQGGTVCLLQCYSSLHMLQSVC